MGGAVAVFAFIGSTLDMLEFEGQLVDALGEYDYGKAVGRGLEVAGAATSAVGGAMVLAGAIYGGSLGPVGALVGAIGGVLVAAGFVVAAWLAHNANEKFASRCFLGIEWGRKSVRSEWSSIELPTAKAKDEASCLVSLLAQFQLKPSAGLGDWYVFIQPGYLEDRWKLEVSLRNSWRNDDPQEYAVTIDLEDDVVTQVSGVPLKPVSSIRRDADGRVDWIAICVDEAKSPEHVLRQFHVARVRTRIVIVGAVQVPKEKGQGVEITLPSSEISGSLDAARWRPMAEAAK
jgi:hypothetical protein